MKHKDPGGDKGVPASTQINRPARLRRASGPIDLIDILEDHEANFSYPYCIGCGRFRSVAFWLPFAMRICMSKRTSDFRAMREFHGLRLFRGHCTSSIISQLCLFIIKHRRHKSVDHQSDLFSNLDVFNVVSKQELTLEVLPMHNRPVLPVPQISRHSQANLEPILPVSPLCIQVSMAWLQPAQLKQVNRVYLPLYAAVLVLEMLTCIA